jgi:hypothetical protein
MKNLLLIILISFAVNLSATEPIKEEAKMDPAKSSTKPEQNFNAPIKGIIIEKINAASYTYLKLKTSTDETWVAVPQLEIALNTEVEMLKPIPMFGFESKTLKRKFDRIFFGVLKNQKADLNKIMTK